jgi:hypothetical protein
MREPPRLEPYLILHDIDEGIVLKEVEDLLKIGYVREGEAFKQNINGQTNHCQIMTITAENVERYINVWLNGEFKNYEN